jgi:hypothetical protein
MSIDTMAVAQENRRPSSIENELQTLNATNDQFHKVVEMLESKLRPVLLPEASEKDPGSPSDPRMTSTIGANLIEANTSYAWGISRLRSLIDRIDL